MYHNNHNNYRMRTLAQPYQQPPHQQPHYHTTMFFIEEADIEEAEIVEELDVEPIEVEDLEVDAEPIEMEQEQEQEQEQKEAIATTMPKEPPKKVFIVPYRNRPQHKFFFSKYMSFLLEDEPKDSYEIYFSHQCDGRTFNRGAAKNIGFLAMKEKYPEHYKQMTFIFNDVDTIPFHKIFTYSTTQGVVKHYYGYEYALGGIVVIKGHDFERINGFPCFWGWGMEDNALQKRCERFGLRIDRSTFYKIGSPEMLQLFDGISRIISKKDPYRMKADNGMDGLCTIRALKYTIDRESTNPTDNLYCIGENDKGFAATFVINIRTFLTHERFEDNKYYKYDLRQPAREIVHPTKLNETRAAVVTTDDWSNIPYYPTTKENRENIARLLVQSGKRIPDSLRRQIDEDRRRELEGDVYNSTAINSGGAGNIGAQHHHPHPHPSHQGHPNGHPLQQHQHQHHHQKQQQIEYARMLQQQIDANRRIPVGGGGAAYKYSPQYAKTMGVRERATKSANIGLGGIISGRR